MPRTRVVLPLVAALGLAFADVPLGRSDARVEFGEPYKEYDEDWPLTPGHEQVERDVALQRARVWTPTDPGSADFLSNPDDPRGTLRDAVVPCRFLSGAATGTTPKFDCVLSDGEVVKVKYGRTGEIHAEVAASRLLSAVGFGADRMFLLPRLRCYGCPRFPFQTVMVLDGFGVRDAVTGILPADRFVDFEWVAVERRFAGHDIVVGEQKGWAWHELDSGTDLSARARAERDAFRVVARFLSHWDNKSTNQRLVCAAKRDAALVCPTSFALISDLGATFGPNKVKIHGWELAPIWADAKGCHIHMRDMPYGGSTFSDVRISEAGRLLIARQLGALSEEQIRDLFEGARFSAYRSWSGDTATISEWVRVFQDKVDQIAKAGPCPG